MGKGKDGTLDAAASHGRITAVCAGLTVFVGLLTIIIGYAS
jgi:hypothetical protein